MTGSTHHAEVATERVAKQPAILIRVTQLFSSERGQLFDKPGPIAAHRVARVVADTLNGEDLMACGTQRLEIITIGRRGKTVCM